MQRGQLQRVLRLEALKTFPVKPRARNEHVERVEAGVGGACPRRFPTFRAPNNIATGDFNGDGKTDLAILDHGPASISFLFNNTP